MRESERETERERDRDNQTYTLCVCVCVCVCVCMCVSLCVPQQFIFPFSVLFPCIFILLRRNWCSCIRLIPRAHARVCMAINFLSLYCQLVIPSIRASYLLSFLSFFLSFPILLFLVLLPYNQQILSLSLPLSLSSLSLSLSFSSLNTFVCLTEVMGSSIRHSLWCSAQPTSKQEPVR